MRTYTADELLEAREKRVGLIGRLLKYYKVPLLVMRVNYPGLEKTNKVTVSIIEAMRPLIRKRLRGKVCGERLMLQGAEGPTFYVAVHEDVLALKALAIDVEERHSLGRCIDLDVYDLEGQSISRQRLGYPRRKCYLCDDYAHNCVRAERHRKDEIIGYIEEKYSNYRESVYGGEHWI